MKKSHFLYLLIFFMVSCKTNKVLTKNNEWISTDNGIFSSSGIILDLTNSDTLSLSNIHNLKDKTTFKYHIDACNNLLLNDTIEFGKITKQTETLLIIKDTIRTHSFIPIRDYHLQSDYTTINEILMSNTWQQKDHFTSLRLEFTNQSSGFNDKRIKKCYRTNETRGFESISLEYWFLAKYKKSFFIFLTRNNFDSQVFQIKNVSDSIILAETFWKDSIEETKFFLHKKLPTIELEKLKQTIIGKWELTEYEEPVDSTMILGLEEEIIPFIRRNGRDRDRPFCEKDSVPLILDSYYSNKNIFYEFSSDGKCTMNTKDLILRESTWELSKDGKYIDLKNGFMGSMKITSVTDSSLVTEKHETIEYEEIGVKGGKDYEDKYIRETFKKVK